VSQPELDKSVVSRGVEECSAAQGRYTTIDLIRGIAMVLMVLDHTRDFLGSSSFDPRDVSDPFLFFIPWITHFCASVFMLLAGASAWFYMQKNSYKCEAARYLFVRGVWLIVLELTVVCFAWTFHVASDFIILQVLWVLGFGMIFLSLMVAWPPVLVGFIGALIMLTHNLLPYRGSNARSNCLALAPAT
jgi:uncharacterized membrane protein